MFHHKFLLRFTVDFTTATLKVKSMMKIHNTNWQAVDFKICASGSFYMQKISNLIHLPGTLIHCWFLPEQLWSKICSIYTPCEFTFSSHMMAFSATNSLLILLWINRDFTPTTLKRGKSAEDFQNSCRMSISARKKSAACEWGLYSLIHLPGTINPQVKLLAIPSYVDYWKSPLERCTFSEFIKWI